MTKKIFFALFSFAIFFTTSKTQAQALHATGGTGAYKNDIWWMNFSDIAYVAGNFNGTQGLAAGNTYTRNFTVGDVTVTVTLDNISFSGQIANTETGASSLTNARIQGYRSGSWAGDGLDDLYNIGGTGTSNTLCNALTTNHNGNASNGGSALTVNFRIRAYATVNGQPMDLGLVLANAEADGSAVEYESISIPSGGGSALKLLEKATPAAVSGFLKQITFSNNNLSAKLSGGSNGSSPTPANVGIVYTTKLATAVADPLTVNMEFASGGRTAMAIGFILDQDISDAPATYGTPVNIFPAAAANRQRNAHLTY